MSYAATLNFLYQQLPMYSHIGAAAYKKDLTNIRALCKVLHQPQKKFTLQIGDGRAIKLITKIPVIYDFRMQDVLMGGNGAPLVPIGDELLFSEFDACLNLGGFSNISLKKNEERIAFDISPVNVVLNFFAEKLGKNYDENGDFAKNGNINLAILEQLNALNFYKKQHPKSLGIEFVNAEIFPLLNNETPENKNRIQPIVNTG